FDLAFTSVLKRAIRTLWLALEELERMWLPVENSWRLKERHYGALQGLNKAEMAAKFGEAQVHTWRRSYDIPPPALAPADERYEGNDPRYAGVSVPRTECLKDTVARVLPYWNASIAPAVHSGKRVLIAAHGNSLRALVKHLDAIGDAEIVGLNIPTGIPLVYELDAELRPRKHYYLGDPAEIERRLAGGREALERTLAERRAALERVLLARQALGAPDVLRAALSGDDPQGLTRRLYYMGYVSRAAAALIAGYRADLEALARLAGEAQAKHERLRAVEQASRAERARLVRERAAR